MDEGTDDLAVHNIDYDADYRPEFHDFYDLMKFRVSKILLVSSLYDAFTLEEDGLIFEQLSEEYRELTLPFPPQVFRVSSGKDALEELRSSSYDMVVTMARISDMDPIDFGKKARSIKEGIPIVLLLTDAGDLNQFKDLEFRGAIDRTFFWNGDSALFMVMTKFIEDMINIDADTDTGRVRIILVVENSPRFYSVFLPIIYTETMRQTQALISEGLNENEKLLRRRARPKILLARNYDEAKVIIEKYRKYILGVISDISYDMGGVKEEEAGFQLAQELGEDFPILLQSSKIEHKDKAEAMGIPFIHKNSESMLHDLRDFFKKHLGFGPFMFMMPDGCEVGKAYDLDQFRELLEKVPPESIDLHGRANEFSKWLIARQEVELAMRLRSKKVTDFRNVEEIRKYLLKEIGETKRRKQMGLIIDFDKQKFEFEGSVTRLGGGSLGGKGRGIAFLSSLLHQTGIETRVRGCRMVIPDTLVIGTDVFDRFLDENDLHDTIHKPPSDEEISNIFINAKLPDEIRRSLSTYLRNVKVPIAVRSSSLLEDSQNQPFAGIYSTYILPNRCGKRKAMLEQLCKAIKLVYASTYFKAARAYIQTTVHITEEDKMAVVIQKLVGNEYDGSFYPVFSGVAQSNNFYPVAPLKREEGVASVALGLGRIVVEGENVLSFSPHHPNAVQGFGSPEEVLKNSQKHFYALDLKHSSCYDLKKGEDVTLVTFPISKAEEHGSLDSIASSYDANDNRIRDGVGYPGPKMITFAGILKYNMVPLVEILKTILEIGRMGMGRDVEIEFAGSIDRKGDPEFYLVQIRPLVTLKERRQVVISDQDSDRAILLTDKALGNGLIERVYDMIFVDPEKFDRSMTVQMAEEIEELNRELKGTPYILIGPGRWGTQDRWLGIPVEWDQISGARAMVEVSLPGFAIDPSHGTHFFHNITSLGIPYFTVMHNRKGHKLNWDRIRQMDKIKGDGLVMHVRSREPLLIKVDGRTGKGMIVEMDDDGDGGIS
ncbi:MAG: PEP/pyruvate-binding domain-containing protein [Candidatus Thermoplasmatota archaeon]|nr:PEP/pyruvate-binding domain-containing protein [Candidatus Thermoplasmatota archaeon]